MADFSFTFVGRKFYFGNLLKWKFSYRYTGQYFCCFSSASISCLPCLVGVFICTWMFFFCIAFFAGTCTFRQKCYLLFSGMPELKPKKQFLHFRRPKFIHVPGVAFALILVSWQIQRILLPFNQRIYSGISGISNFSRSG